MPEMGKRVARWALVARDWAETQALPWLTDHWRRIVRRASASRRWAETQAVPWLTDHWRRIARRASASRRWAETQALPWLADHWRRIVRRASVSRRWAETQTLPWLTDRRQPATHGALIALGVFAIVLAVAGVGRGDGDPARLSYLLPPRDATLQAAPTPAPDSDAGEPTPTREPAPFYTYEIQEGDTLVAIAEQYGVGVDYLLWNNPELTADPDLLRIGAELLVPAVEGIVYDVRLGDTINSIAATYGIEPQAIIDYEYNDLDSPDVILEGLVLVLPEGVPPPPPAPVIVEPAPEPQPLPVAPDPPAVSAPLPAGVGDPVPEAVIEPVIIPSFGYIWPVVGSLNSQYGPRWGSFHKGLDIGAPYGTPVAAAGSGQVVLATYRNNGYGNYVIVRHSDGSEALYAHLSEIWVSLGQYVNQGEGVGAVGCTGWCSGNHLHFEVYVGGAPVNPLGYLP